MTVSYRKYPWIVCLHCYNLDLEISENPDELCFFVSTKIHWPGKPCISDVLTLGSNKRKEYVKKNDEITGELLIIKEPKNNKDYFEF